LTTNWTVKSITFLKFEMFIFELYRFSAYLQAIYLIYTTLIEYYAGVYLEDIFCFIIK